MIFGPAVKPGSHLHGSRNRLGGRATKGHQGARKGWAFFQLPKSSTRSVMNHSERWLLAGSRASGGLANQDNPVYRSRFHAPVPVLDRNATTPLHPAAPSCRRPRSPPGGERRLANACDQTPPDGSDGVAAAEGSGGLGRPGLVRPIDCGSRWEPLIASGLWCGYADS